MGRSCSCAIARSSAVSCFFRNDPVGLFGLTITTARVRSEIAEGVIVGEGSVLSMGVFIGQSTKIVDRHTGEIFRGRVPSYSVVVPGSLPQGPDKPALYCAVIVKRVDERTRSKTSINELLRD